MTYYAAFEPKVIRTYPRNLQKDVPHEAIIKIDFNTDLDRDYIEPYILVSDDTGRPIPGRVTYNERTISFVPDAPFPSLATIRVTVVGDDLSGKNIGIRSVTGERMRGNFVFSFTVAQIPQLPPPRLLSPQDQSVIRSQPAFSWEPVPEADHYEIELSTSNTMNPVIWPAREESYQLYDVNNPVTPDVVLEDGIYYWRMRAVRADGQKGEWSPIYTFHLDTQVEGAVTDEDAPPVDFPLYEEEARPHLEVLEVFPEDGQANVPTTLKTIAIRVVGTYSLEDVQEGWNMTGTYIEGDIDPALSHGTVNGTLEVIPQEDGTTLILFTPDPLEETDES